MLYTAVALFTEIVDENTTEKARRWKNDRHAYHSRLLPAQNFEKEIQYMRMVGDMRIWKP